MYNNLITRLNIVLERFDNIKNMSQNEVEKKIRVLKGFSSKNY